MCLDPADWKLVKSGLPEAVTSGYLGSSRNLMSSGLPVGVTQPALMFFSILNSADSGVEMRIWN